MESKSLDDGMVLRNACADDIPAIIAHVRAVHGEEVVDGIRAMYESHPRMSWDDTFVIANPDDGTIISSLVLLSGTWLLDGVEVETAQMEVVGTLEEYRHRGYSRILNEAFERRVAEIGPVIQVIAGIPYFYRNFGYEYASPLGGTYPVASTLIPRLPEGENESVAIEEVTQQSIKDFLEFRSVHLPTGTWLKDIREEDLQYYSFDCNKTDTEGWFFHLVREKKRLVGVFVLSRWAKNVDIICLHLKNHVHLDSVLRFASARAREWNNQTVRVAPPNQPVVHEYLRSIASVDMQQRYAWYVKIPSIQRFIETLSPVLSQRLRNSEYNKHETTLKMTDYKRGFSIRFSDGRFEGVSSMNERDLGKYDLAAPTGPLTRLLMGYETLDELKSHEPDVLCKAISVPLVRTLFPKVNATVDPFY
ncbi:MAG: GNAT family N-acetyltransferase [Candidatus Thorarchaeota archaeon]